MEENTDIEIPQEVEPDETEFPEEKPAALTLVIQSWATPIVGIVMLVVGLLGGYYGRSLLLPETSPSVVEGSASTDPEDGAATSPRVVEGSPSTDNENAPVTIPTPDAERAAQQQEMMNAVVELTRHFRGDPDAPITIIEFSDFQ